MKKGFTLPEVLVSLIIFSLIIGIFGRFQGEFINWEKHYFLENMIFHQQRIGLQYLEHRLKDAEELIQVEEHSLCVGYAPLELYKKGYRYYPKREKNRKERYYLSSFKQEFYANYPAPKMGLVVERNSRSPIVYYFGEKKEDLKFLYLNKFKQPLLSKEERQSETYYIHVSIQTPIKNGKIIKNEVLVSLPHISKGDTLCQKF